MDKLVSSFPTGRSEELRVHLKELRGSAVVDLRVYSALKAHAEEKIPTGRGITVPASRLEDLKRAVLAAEASLKELSLLP